LNGKRYILLLLLLVSINGLAQNGFGTNGFWNLTTLTGKAHIKGYYREREKNLSTLSEFSQRTFVSGGLLLNSESFILHPNFLKLNLGLEYNPGTDQEDYLVIPDRSEVLTNKLIDLRATLFGHRSMNLNFFANYNQNYANRENLTSVKSDNKLWGLVYNFRNKISPVNLRYSERRYDQKELETARTYENKQDDFQARFIKSFSILDNHELVYNHNEFFRQDWNLNKTVNITDHIYLRNSIFFDSLKKYNIRSKISNLQRRGIVKQDRFHIAEDISVELPKKFRLSAKYNYYNEDLETQKYKQHNIIGLLSHELFQSLRTNGLYEYFNTDHSAYQEMYTRAGIDITYVKKMIMDGQLNLSYSFTKRHQEFEGVEGPLNVINEEQFLSDGQIVLLGKPYVDSETIVVRDETRSIIYQLNFDYLLFERGDFLEIQRIPGGQIANNSIIFIDYTAIQPGSYKFDMDYESFSAGIMLFKRLIELYFRSSKQDYKNTETTDFLTLKYFTQNVFGVRVEVGPFRGGIEFDNYESNIVPYSQKKYYLQLYGQLGKNIRYTLNGDIIDYHFTSTGLDQLYSNINGNINYRLSPKSNINFEVGYRNQEGEGIDLNLYTARAEFITAFREMSFKIGLEKYNRDYIGDMINFNGIYFEISRRI